MKKFIAIFCIVLIFCFSLTGCDSTDYEECEVLSIFTYTEITGKEKGRPLEEVRIGFVYSDNGAPKLVSSYYKRDTDRNGRYIIIGDENKYVIVPGYKTIDTYLYLTQETYDSLTKEANLQ